MACRPKTRRSRSSSRGPPAPPFAPTERPLDPLAGDHEGEGAGRRIRAGRNVERRHGIPELRLVEDPDRGGRVEARDAGEPDARERGERSHPGREGRGCVADVGPEADVRTNDRHGAENTRMHPVSVLILHRPAPAGAGAPLTTLVADARGALAGRQAGAFVRAGAADARVVAEAVEESFGARLRRLAKTLPAGHGLVVLGSGSIPLATSHDLGALVGAAASAAPGALANNRYSADVVALSAPVVAALRDLPDLPGDNALPRWLEEVAGIPVADLRTRWRLAIDLDAPADLLLPGVLAATGLPRPAVLAEAADRLAAVLATLADRRAEVAIAGRTSAATLVALEITSGRPDSCPGGRARDARRHAAGAGRRDGRAAAPLRPGDAPR